MSNFTMIYWHFTKPGEQQKVISATYPMTEAQAREAAKRKGWDVEGWTSEKRGQLVYST